VRMVWHVVLGLAKTAQHVVSAVVVEGEAGLSLMSAPAREATRKKPPTSMSAMEAISVARRGTSHASSQVAVS